MKGIFTLIGLGVGAGALWLLTKGGSIASMARNLTYKIRLDGKPKFYGGGFISVVSSIMGGSGSRLRFPLAIDFENRSDEEITVGVNALFIHYKGKKMASGGVNPTSVKIAKFAKSTMSGLNVDVEVSSLIQVAGDAVRTMITNQDFSGITKDISVQLTAVINDTFVFDLTCPLGEGTTVSADTGVSGVDDVAAPDGYHWEESYATELNGGKVRKVKKLKRNRLMSAAANVKRHLNRADTKTTTHTNAAAAVTGLGLVAASMRKIKDISDYISYIPPREQLKRKDLVVIPDGSVRDTANLMREVAERYKSDTATLAQRLNKDGLKETLQNIWNFVYTYIQYVPDSRVREQVRRPLRTLYDQQGDCDCYATLIASMLINLNIPYHFRIAAYSAGRYQHVYVVVPHDGGYYVVDPVLDKCFAEKTPSKFFDV